MTGEELDTYQNELEIDSGNVSNWDHLRALITLKKMLTDRHSQIIKAYNTKEIASEQDGKIEPRTRDWFDVNDF